ncbi:steroid delta-isomerase [Rhodococcus hoagii]|nr:steroid delta-isomerase [Prescottella equi]
MASAEDIKNTVASYMKALESKSADQVAALFAEGATVEDRSAPSPSGRRGDPSVLQGHRGDGPDGRAADHPRRRQQCRLPLPHARSKVGGQTYVMEPIDVMTFDDDAKITSTRAYWAQEDMIVS